MAKEHVEARSTVDARDSNVGCAPCHREIYERYRTTPMANASGPAIDGFIPGDFVHANSAVHYRVAEESGQVWLTYERDSASPDKELKGKEELLYFIGSGKRGRTYLFEQQGYWFEAPINWYSKKQLWDMAPNFQSAREMPLTCRSIPAVCTATHPTWRGPCLTRATSMRARRFRTVASPAPPATATQPPTSHRPAKFT